MQDKGLYTLVCTNCARTHDPAPPLTLCPECGGILDPKYDLGEIAQRLSKDEVSKRARNMWRWAEFLPVTNPAKIVSAGEGGTPLVQAARLREKFELRHLGLKDETKNPTGTFKDRGAAATVSVLTGLGVRETVLASEGNAGCSFALYCNMAGIRCTIFYPTIVSLSKLRLARSLRARVHLAKGTIQDAGAKAGEYSRRRKLYNSSTFITPYRHDGKGTMALEIAQDLGWNPPDAVIYPVGGGVGMVGMWKAFKALSRLGWTSKLPRMIGVQPTGCAPVIKAFQGGREDVQEWKRPRTIASGLQIPKPLAGRLILNAMRESGGAGITVSEKEIVEAARLTAKLEGLLLEPSSAAAVAAIPVALGRGVIDPSESVVVIATGTALKTVADAG